ncbi:hypothetical protein ACIQWQ_02710 [Peribacillus frigoritolerans]
MKVSIPIAFKLAWLRVRKYIDWDIGLLVRKLGSGRGLLISFVMKEDYPNLLDIMNHQGHRMISECVRSA